MRKGGTLDPEGPGGTLDPEGPGATLDPEEPGVKGAREVESLDVLVVAARGGALMSWHDLAISP